MVRERPLDGLGSRRQRLTNKPRRVAAVSSHDTTRRNHKVGTLCMGEIRNSRYRNGHALWPDGPHGTARGWLRRRHASFGVAEDWQNPTNAPRCAPH